MMSVFMIVLFTKSYWDQGGGGWNKPFQIKALMEN
jgi:hypothetical protein